MLGGLLKYCFNPCGWLLVTVFCKRGEYTHTPPPVHLQKVAGSNSILGLNLFSFLAILVTGGHGGDTSAELLSTNGSAIFELPKMSQPKRYHTQSGLTACGGYVFGSEERSCIRFEFGSWTNLTGNLLYRVIFG